jgi:SAM-dependent methyltransferase
MAKTIAEKLNLLKYKKAAVLQMPDGRDYFPELEGYSTELAEGASYDLIFAFVLDMPSLQNAVAEIINGRFLKPGGYLYLAYPKKGNKVYESFIHRDELLEGLGADEDGYVNGGTVKFSRMVGLDEVFTVVGLKEDSGGKNKVSSKASQCVDDYVHLIPEIEKDLGDRPDLLSFYQDLTPGYRKDWARYVYSAKQEATRQKRREEMKMIMSEGYKSRELYRRDR